MTPPQLTIQEKNKTASGLNPVFISSGTHANIKALSATLLRLNRNDASVRSG